MPLGRAGLESVSGQNTEMTIPTRIALRLCAVAVSVALVACSRINGRAIIVEFRNAEGVRGSEAVYLAGVKVGRVIGEPSLVSGKARVSVSIESKHKDGVPVGTVFLLTTDPNDSKALCLIGYSPGLSPSGTVDKDPLYAGASNRAELILILGTEKASKLWEDLIR